MPVYLLYSHPGTNIMSLYCKPNTRWSSFTVKNQSVNDIRWQNRRLEVFAGLKWRYIVCSYMSVYIDGVFVKCYSKILDCNIDFYFIF